MSRGGLKRISLLVLVLFLTGVFLFGCTPAEDPAAEPGEESPAPEEVEDEKWPTEPITIIAPVNPGGGVDMMARGIASHLPKYLGVPVVVENIGGGLCIPGIMEFLKNRPDDGSTLLAIWQTVLSDRYINHDADYTIDDFAFINIQQVDPVSIITHKDAPWDTFEELVNDMKKKPGEITVAYMSGASCQVAVFDLMDTLGLEPRYVSYDGGTEFRLAVAGKHVDVGAGHAIGDAVFAEDLKMLAIYSKEPFELWPDAPPINEALKPFGVEVSADLGSTRMLATHSTFKEKYPERWETLLEAYKNMLDDEGYQAYLKQTGEASSTTWVGPEEALRITLELDELVLRYKGK